jgi:hypothetical protein
MADDRTILLKVELDVAQLSKNAKDAEDKLKQLVPVMEKIKKEQGQHSIEYKKAQAEVRNYNKVLTDSVKALQQNAKTTESNSGSIIEMREQLSAATYAYNNLTKEQRENSDVGISLRNDIKSISDALKEQEGAIGDNRRNVGNYAGAIAELKAELKAYKGEMLGLDADSERYRELSIRAGEVADKIKEVNENTKAQTGGTGFEKLSNNLGLIKGDLENLDFEGVSEKMGQMALISKNMTFKEALGGLKNMGQSLISLGKAILLNPMFLIAGAIAGIVVALKMWNDNINEEAIAAQQKHVDSMKKSIEMIEAERSQIQKISDLRIRLAEKEGKSAKEMGVIRLQALIDDNAKMEEQMKKYLAIENSLYKLSKRDLSDEQRKENMKQRDEARDSYNELLRESATFELRKRVQIAENNEAILNEQKDAAEKQKAAAQKAHDERIALERRMRDLYLEGIDLSNENEEASINAKYRFFAETSKGSAEELLQIEKDKNEELSALDKKYRDQEISRINEAYRREIEDAKGNEKVIAQLEENKALEIEGVQIEYGEKKKIRESEQHKNEVELNKRKVTDEKKTAAEIELIEAELNYLKKKGTSDEFSAWSDVQFAKIRQIETLSALELENENLTAQEKLKIAKETELAIQQIQNDSFEQSKEATKKQNEWTQEQKKDVALSAVNGAQQLSDIFFQISQNQIQQELNDEQQKYDAKSVMLQNQLDNGLITQAEFNAQKSALDSAYNAKEKALKEEQFKRNKAAQLINATIAAAVGVVNAMAAPPPVGLIMAGIASALGAAQVALIASQPTPIFERGGEPLKSGVFGGKPHSHGGTKGVFDDGTQIEVEKDEAFFVINKRSTGMISALSNLNMKGGGVPLMEKGGSLKFATGGVFANQITQSASERFNMQNQIVEAVRNIPAPRVLVEDINSAQGTLASVVDRANY